MDHESMRALIGAVLLWAMGIAAVLYLVRKNWEQIKEICLDDNGKFDPIGGLEKRFAQDSEPEEQDIAPDEMFMALLMKQKGAQVAGFDPERDHVREQIIFRGRVQGAEVSWSLWDQKTVRQKESRSMAKSSSPVRSL